MKMFPRPRKLAVILAALVVSSLSTFPRVSSYSASTSIAQAAERRVPARCIASDDVMESRAMEALGKLPLRFEESRSRRPDDVRFITRGTGFEFGVLPAEAVMRLHQKGACSAELRRATSLTDHSLNARRQASLRPATDANQKTALVRMQLVGGNPRASVVGQNELLARTNYFIGNDSTRWQTEAPNYARVRVEGVYRGVDVVYYGSSEQLEYDFNVAPGADFKAIRLRFDGTGRISVDRAGELVIDTPAGEVRQRKPIAYQSLSGVRKTVPARYVICGKRDVRFVVGEHDKHLPLVIDPILVYSTYLGGLYSERTYGLALDATGNAYVTGETYSPDFPITGAIQPVHIQPYSDVFIVKLDMNRNELVYSTYLGGSYGDTGNSIAVDAAGNAYVTGVTSSPDFPATGGLQPMLAGGKGFDAFIAKLSPDGSVLGYSTYLGGGVEDNLQSYDAGNSIAVDTFGNAYVTGVTDSTDFPTTFGALQSTLNSFRHAFVTKLNATGSALLYSTYLGGSGSDVGLSLALDVDGNAYVTGYTTSFDFPVTAGALQSRYGSSPGLEDAFVTKLNATGTALVYSTYLGGSDPDRGNAIAVDALGNAYVAGVTDSFNFPTTSGALKPEHGGGFYKSSSAGKRWQVSNAGLPTPTPYALAVDPKMSGHIFLATDDGLFTSTDGGDTWKLASRVGTISLLIDPLNPTTLYGNGSVEGGAAGIIKSSDSGLTWVSKNMGLPKLFSVFHLIIDPVNPLTLYVSGLGVGDSFGELPPRPHYFFKTTDGGDNWEEIRSLSLFQAPDLLAIDPHDPSRLFLDTASLLYRTQDGGATWKLMSDHSGYGPLAVDPKASGVLYGIGVGVGKSTDDGRTWARISQGLPAQFFFRSFVAVPTTPTTLYLGTGDGIFKSSDAGASWQRSAVTGDIAFVAFNPGDKLTAYTGVTDYTDAFVAKLNASGSALVYSTLLGGQSRDEAHGIAVDNSGSVYVTGETGSSGFPVLNALQSSKPQTIRFYIPYSSAGFLTKLNATGGGLLYSTYLGGDDNTLGRSVSLSTQGDVYVAGDTGASNFPIQDGVQREFAGEQDSFLLKLGAPHVDFATLSGKTLYVVGANFDQGAIILVDGQEQVTDNSFTPTRKLLANKAGKFIAPGQEVRVRVRNADGTLSNEIRFTRTP